MARKTESMVRPLVLGALAFAAAAGCTPERRLLGSYRHEATCHYSYRTDSEVGCAYVGWTFYPKPVEDDDRPYALQPYLQVASYLYAATRVWSNLPDWRPYLEYAGEAVLPGPRAARVLLRLDGWFSWPPPGSGGSLLRLYTLTLGLRISERWRISTMLVEGSKIPPEIKADDVEVRYVAPLGRQSLDSEFGIHYDSDYDSLGWSVGTMWYPVKSFGLGAELAYSGALDRHYYQVFLGYDPGLPGLRLGLQWEPEPAFRRAWVQAAIRYRF